jgi:hypothetical protein
VYLSAINLKGHRQNASTVCVVDRFIPHTGGHDSPTVPGIVAHQSALKNGELMKVPSFDGQG